MKEERSREEVVEIRGLGSGAMYEQDDDKNIHPGLSSKLLIMGQ